MMRRFTSILILVAALSLSLQAQFGSADRIRNTSDALPSGTCQWGKVWGTQTAFNFCGAGGSWITLGSGGSMVYPSAGVPLSVNGTSWGTSYTVGTGANNLVQFTAAGKYPAVDGSLITNIVSSVAAALTAQYINWDATSGPTSIANKPSTFTPVAHASSHLSNGADAIAAASTTVRGTVTTTTSNSQAVSTNDSRMTDARAPTTHGSSHASNGADAVPAATTTVRGTVTTTTSSSQAVSTDDSRMTNSRAPTAHASSHQNGGADEVATATSAANAIPKAGSDGKLAVAWIPTLSAYQPLATALTTIAALTNTNHAIMINNGSAWVEATVPDCPSGKLLYTASTHAFSCGTDATGGAPAAPMVLTGSTDDIQFDLKGNATQTNPIMRVRKSDNTVAFQVNADGSVDVGSGSGGWTMTAETAPSTPAAGKGVLYLDSTSKNIAVKDDAGVVKHGVQTKAAVTSQVVSAIADDGTVTTRPLATADLPSDHGTPSAINLANATALPTAGLANNAVTSAKMAVVNTRRVCDMIFGDASGSALANGQLGPQKRLCLIPAAATLQEVIVSADGGTPNIIIARNVAGTVANVVSSALATAASGGIACSKTSAVAGIDGTTCAATLQNTALAAGSYLEAVSGTAGGTAKLMTVHAVYTID